MTNILGDRPKLGISDWLSGLEVKKFPLKRDVPWTPTLTTSLDREQDAPIAYKPGTGESPEGLFGIDNLKHRDRRILSVINVPLWNKAGWKATAFLCSPHPDAPPPILVLGFQDPEVAKLIFRSWRDRFGPIDTSEQLTLSIIRGIDKAAPASYKVVIGSNPKLHKGKVGSSVVVVSRINRMDPPDSRNLDLFLREFEQKKNYLLAPAHYRDLSTMPEVFVDLCIEKHELHVKQAWEIGRNDLELCAISEDDDPIIPEDIKDPPVLKALESISKMRKRQLP